MLRTRLSDALDVIVAADPGFTRLTLALDATLARLVRNLGGPAAPPAVTGG